MCYSVYMTTTTTETTASLKDLQSLHQRMTHLWETSTPAGRDQLYLEGFGEELKEVEAQIAALSAN